LSLAAFAVTLLLAGTTLADAPTIHIDGLAAPRAAELERALAPALTRARAGKLTVKVVDDRATVTFTPNDGPTLTRTLVLTGDEAEKTRAVVWLAENLSRDEASELSFPEPKPAAPEPPKPEPAEPKAPEPPKPAEIPAVVAEAATKPRASDPCDAPMRWHPLSLAIVSPLAYPATPSDTRFGLALLYGQFGAVDGAAVGLVNHVRCDVRGTSIASVVGIAGRDVSGASVSMLHVVGRDTRGVGISSSLGLYGRDVNGAAIGIVNVVGGVSRGAFVAGGINLQRGKVEGAAISVVNVAQGDVEGAQVGVVSYARRVHGLQLGVVNVAEEADAAVGVLSISWARPFRAAARSTLMRPIAGSLLFEGGRTFSEIGASYSRRLGADRDRFAVSIDVGAHVLVDDDRGMVLDLAVGLDSAIGPDVADEGGAPTGRLETRFGYRAARRFLPQVVVGAMLMPETTLNPLRIVPDLGVQLTF